MWFYLCETSTSIHKKLLFSDVGKSKAGTIICPVLSLIILWLMDVITPQYKKPKKEFLKEKMN